MSTPFNNLTPAEAERLALISEEAGEIVQIIGKILRHGYSSHHPVNPRDTNRVLLTKEIGDLLAALRIASAAADYSPAEARLAERNKLNRINNWLHHNTVSIGASDYVHVAEK